MKMPPNNTLRYELFETKDLNLDECVFTAEASHEERSQIQAWIDLKNTDPSRILFLQDIGPDKVNVKVQDECKEVLLTDENAILSLIKSENLLIDITSLPHHIWAPLFKIYFKAGKKLRALYVEPDEYKTHPSPSSANLFDLSISFEGLSPLPGFAKLDGPEDDDKALFVTFLGFEGNRAERIINQIEPSPKVIPIIGVPGFQINYPAITVACNRFFLKEFDCNSDIRLAKASCPFEAFEMLSSIHRDFPDCYLYIAPVGTRPHVLGAVKYVIQNEDHCEILFDHPKRQEKRTSGRGLIHVFDFNA